MGWTSFYTDYKTNKESFVNEVLHNKTEEIGEDGKVVQRYLEVTQRGSNILLLGQNADGKYWIDLFLCRRENGQFFYKGMSAFDNAKGGSIPKKWLEHFDPEDEWVKTYLAHTEEEAKRVKPKIGDVVKYTNDNYAIVWGNGYMKVEPNADFYVRVEVKNPFAKRQTKMYRLLQKTANGFVNTNCRVMERSLKYLPLEIVK